MRRGAHPNCWAWVAPYLGTPDSGYDTLFPETLYRFGSIQNYWIDPKLSPFVLSRSQHAAQAVFASCVTPSFAMDFPRANLQACGNWNSGDHVRWLFNVG